MPSRILVRGVAFGPLLFCHSIHSDININILATEVSVILAVFAIGPFPVRIVWVILCANHYFNGDGVKRLMTKTTAIAAIASGNSRRSLRTVSTGYFVINLVG